MENPSLMMSFSLITEGYPHWSLQDSQCPGSESRTSPFAESEGQGAVGHRKSIWVWPCWKPAICCRGFLYINVPWKTMETSQLTLLPSCAVPDVIIHCFSMFFHWISPLPWMAKASPFAPKLAWLETPKKSRNSTWKNQPRMPAWQEIHWPAWYRMVLWSIHQSG